MARTIIITADDYGLSRGITDSILETVDEGPVQRVSILANGDAVEYALAEYEKRKNRLAIALHLNLTEGKPFSAPADIPHLVNAGGYFHHSVGSLWLSYMLASRRVREALRAEIRQEAELQATRICRATGVEAIAVNGHQQVHILPFVSDELFKLRNVSSLRSVHEPFYLAGLFAPLHVLALPIVRILSRRAAVATRAGNEHFIGFLYSGHMTLERVRQGLRHIPLGEVEILFHPGSALQGELGSWAGDIRWHYAPGRSQERAVLQSAELAKVLQSFIQSTLPQANFRIFEIGRFTVAGLIATGTNVGLLYLFTEFFGLWYLLSAAVAFSIATVVGFTLQKFWAFSHHSLQHMSTETSMFLLNNLFGLVFTMVGMYTLVEYAGLWYMTAQILLLVIVATWNFFVYRFVIFKKSTPQSAEL